MRIGIDHLETLLHVVDEGSFDGAAAVLRISPSAVSQRIKTLEERAGRVLLQRGKPVTPTPAAVSYLQAARQIRAIVDNTIEALPQEATRLPEISIAANADSIDTWLVEVLSSVRDTATFHILRDDQDHTASLLRAGTVMAGITSTAEPVQGCESTRLGVMRYLATASPEFVAQWFPPSLKDSHALRLALQRAPMLAFDRKDDLQALYLASRGCGDATPPHHYIPSNLAFIEAQRQELGWGLTPELQVRGLLDSGELVALPGHVDVVLYWQQWRISSAPLQALKKAAVDAAAYLLDPRRPAAWKP